jgi:hypothetical protein
MAKRWGSTIEQFVRELAGNGAATHFPQALVAVRRQWGISAATASRHVGKAAATVDSAYWFPARRTDPALDRTLSVLGLYRGSPALPPPCAGCRGPFVVEVASRFWPVLRTAQEMAAALRGVQVVPSWVDRMAEPSARCHVASYWSQTWRRALERYSDVMSQAWDLVPGEVLRREVLPPRFPLPDDGDGKGAVLELLLAEAGWVTRTGSRALPAGIHPLDVDRAVHEWRLTAEGSRHTLPPFEAELKRLYLRALDELTGLIGRDRVEALDSELERGLSYWIRFGGGKLAVAVTTRRRVVGMAETPDPGAGVPLGCWHRLEHDRRFEDFTAVEVPLWPGAKIARIERAESDMTVCRV